jgi:hypothetical protein
MSHPLIDQFRFTRREWLRGLAGITETEATRHCGQMNCVSWIVGHLAWHEQRYWLQFGQERILYPQLNELYAFGAPMCTPALAEMAAIWRDVTQAADSYLDTLTSVALAAELLRDGEAVGQSVGSALQRITYHYWFHTGEILAIRQMLGHQDLPEFVGDIETEAPYRPA